MIAGAVAGSISLVGFGIDSFIEVISGAALLWRMSVDADADLVFDLDIDGKWQRALGKLGVDLTMLSTDAGHA